MSALASGRVFLSPILHAATAVASHRTPHGLCWREIYDWLIGSVQHKLAGALRSRGGDFSRRCARQQPCAGIPVER